MEFVRDNIADRFRDKSFDIAKTDYKFMKIKKAKEDIKKKYPNIPIIDLGVGEPDKPAHESICQILCNECAKSENRFYADNGIFEFQLAACEYMKNLFGVTNLDPHKEILHGIGAKSILSLLALCFINSGDITLTTIPSYPILSTHTKYLGGVVYGLPLTIKNDFYPDLLNIPNIILHRSKLLYINYPNNPTGQVASVDFYKKVVDFAHKNKIIVIADSTYAPLTFSQEPPLSFLSIDGAKDVGIEIHSLSKAFNMTSWRLAFIAGNKQIIDIFANVKANSDSGQFRAIQKAGAYALDNYHLIDDNRNRYSRRFDLLVRALKELGFPVSKPKATFYLYSPIPKGTADGIVFNSAEDFSLFLLERAQICTVPWDNPEPYVRLSVTFEANSIQEEINIINDLKNRLHNLNLIF